MKKVMLTLLLLSLCSTLMAEDRIVRLLKESRSDISFKPLSHEDKYTILQHAQVLFSKLYVNLEHKKNIYKVDPLRDLEKVFKNYKSMDDFDFHKAMLKIFRSVEDYHVNYFLPKPYSCYTTVLPLSFAKIPGGKIIVSFINISHKEELPDLLKITSGDELITYNKLTAKEALNSMGQISIGSTPDAKTLQNVYHLFWRGLHSNLAPKEDGIKLVLKKPSGETYSLEVPWLSMAYPSCLNPAPKEKSTSMGEGQGSPFEQQLHDRNQYLEDTRKEYLRFFKNKIKITNKSMDSTERVDLSALNTTNHPNLFWKTFNYQDQNFGYLRLNSFVADKGFNLAVSEVRSVLSNNLSNTSALVIDLRGNYGGSIIFAEKMMTLFTSNPVRPLPFYIRANEFTALLFKNTATWKDLIFSNIETNRIVGPAGLISKTDLTMSSQAYFGKVVLLTNSECFSSCDLFAASMKDLSNVTIYGTDHSTFGGGANVWSSKDLESLFNAINIPSKLPQDINMRITMRHARRISNNALIEDSGVASDIYLSENIEDVLNPQKSSVVARIFKDLSELTDLSASSSTALIFDVDIFQKHGDENLVINAAASNIGQVALYKDDKIVGRFYTDSDDQININLPLPFIKYGHDIFEIYGFSKDSSIKTPIFRRTISVETLGNYKKLETIHPVEDAVLVNFPPKDNCGWKKINDNLVLTTPYCSMMKMEAIESVELPEDVQKISFDLSSDTEADCDFFEIAVIYNGKEEKLLQPISQPTSKHFELSLRKYAGKMIDIKFRLKSDEEFSGKGIIISNLVIR